MKSTNFAEIVVSVLFYSVNCFKIQAHHKKPCWQYGAAI